jgi:hypothetical protein
MAAEVYLELLEAQHRRIQELEQQLARRGGLNPPDAQSGRAMRTLVTIADARNAIIYREILGPPLSRKRGRR